MVRSIRGLQVVLVVLLGTMLIVYGAPPSVSAQGAKVTFRIGLQVNLISQAIRVVMEKYHFAEKHDPSLSIGFLQTTSGPGLNDALIANSVQGGFLAGPPMLIGWDRGVNYRIALGAGVLPVTFVTNRADIHSLKDVPSGAKIAIPGPGSFQQIVLQMAADKELGNPHVFDNNLVAMAQPDALIALLNKQDITVFGGASPYTSQALLTPGVHAIVSAADLFGGPNYPFHLFVVTTDFHAQHPATYRAVIDGLRETLNWIRDHPRETAELVVKEVPQVSVDSEYRNLTETGVSFSTVPQGLMTVAKFMHAVGTLRKLPATWRDLVFENLASEPGS